MPFKSEAQRRKFAEMVEQGTMDQSTFDQWNSETTGPIPERVEPKFTKNPFTKTVRQTGKVREIK